jgi:outer membrane protein OmpA-like peptidoglycan-associated protein
LLGTEALNQTNNKVAEKGVTGDLKFQTNVILSAEFGVILDEWILPPPPRRRRGTRAPEPVRPSFRASVFVDYGLLNINSFNSINLFTPTLIDYYKTGEKVNTPLDLEVSSLFNSNLAHKKNVNSLMAGVKLTVFMPTKQKPPKKPIRKPPVRKPPVARPPKPKPVAPLFYAKIYDKETNATLSANYQLIDTKSKKEILTGVTEATSGFIQSELKNGNYSLLVNKDGYLYYETPVTTIKGDTLLIALQPIKKEVKVVLNNLFFDVDKWVIKAQSQPTLDDLYLFLTDNPTVKIHITGHTDSSGALKHNMTLSENRAKAVVEWLVKEGIDKSRLSYEGKGPNEPVDTNDTAEGKANNRRVEFVIK